MSGLSRTENLIELSTESAWLTLTRDGVANLKLRCAEGKLRELKLAALYQGTQTETLLPGLIPRRELGSAQLVTVEATLTILLLFTSESPITRPGQTSMSCVGEWLEALDTPLLRLLGWRTPSLWRQLQSQIHQANQEIQESLMELPPL